MTQTRALIFGVTGQDGSHLAEYLLANGGYKVYGFLRKTSTGNLKNIEGLRDITLIHGDITDYNTVYRAIEEANPDEIYNQADLDHVGWSWANPDYAYRVTGLAPANIFEYCKGSKVKILQPISSTIYTGFSPYSCAKSFVLRVAQMYRELGMHISTPILFNHESTRRTEDYVTRKISRSVARIKNGLQDKMTIGDTSAQIDWGWSPEFVQIETEIIHKNEIIEVGTGELHSVQEFLEEAFSLVGLDWKQYVVQDPALMRPTKQFPVASRGIKTKVRFKDIVRQMVEYDLQDTRIKALDN